MLVYKRPWTRQPQGVVGIDWRNPLLDGAEFIRLGSQQYWNPARAILTQTGGSAVVPTPAGAGKPISASVYESYPTPVATGGTGPWTLAGIFMPVSGLGASTVSVAGYAEGPGATTNDRSIRLLSGTTWQAYLFDGGAKTATTTVTAAHGQVASVIATTDGATLVCNADNVEASAGVSSGGFNGYSVAEMYLGAASQNWASMVIAVPLFIRTRKYWPPALRASFTANPWQIFKPRHMYLKSEAPTGPTVLAVTPTTIGSTSHRPRYTWTPA